MFENFDIFFLDFYNQRCLLLQIYLLSGFKSFSDACILYGYIFNLEFKRINLVRPFWQWLK